MNKELSHKLIQVWWVGFKVLCRLCAIGIILTILLLPAMIFIALFGKVAGGIIFAVLALLIAPIVCGLVSKHLLLFGDNYKDIAENKDYKLRDKIIISAVVSFYVITFLSPPDPITQFIFASAGALLCGVSLLILARYNFIKSLSNSVHTLICIFVCVVSILSFVFYMFIMRAIH